MGVRQVGCRIIKTVKHHATPEPKRFKSEEEAVRELERRIRAAESEGFSGGSPEDDGNHYWWIRSGDYVVRYRTVVECSV
jgi:hypothetical protein